MIRRIIAYVLFGLGFLTITYFRKYSGDIIPYPFLFWILGCVMFLVGLLFLRNTLTTKEVKIKNQVEKEIANLKVNGEKILVDLSQCEVKENNYYEEKRKYGHENELLTLDVERHIEGWNALSGHSADNVKQVHMKQTVLVFSSLNRWTGGTEKFISRVIPKDKITLSFNLAQQKQTTLYVDKTDRESYYFDLDFLNI